MKICVTGGCGFIGANYILNHIKTNPNDIIVNIDALTYAGNPENLSSLAGDEATRYVFYRGDISDRNFVNSVFEANMFDAVVNFAAESHVDRSIKNPALFLQTNVAGTQVLLDASRMTGVKRYLQISTDEVYGSLPETGAFYEETPLSPRSPYSASKASADHLVLAYHHTYGMNVVITRCSNNYGPYQFPEKMLPLMTLNALRDLPLPVYGDGMQRREWLHVTDHCRAIDLVLEKGRPGEVYNVGGFNEKCNMDVLELLLKTLNKPHDLIKHVTDRLGHDRRYCINSSKIQKELGWNPKVSFEDGIVDTIHWYVNHPEWWGKILSGDYQKYYKEMYENRV